MSFVLGRGFVDIDLETGKFQKGISGVESRLKSFQTKLQGAAAFARRFLVGAAAAGGGSLLLAGRQEKAEARLAAVIRATGMAAGKTSEELKKQASSLQDLTGYGDDAILSMQAVLLTFKNIKGEEFDRATKAAIDLAAVLDTDLKSAGLQLGKALEDPTKGMSALTRSGVSFSKQEQDKIKALQASGKLFEAQRVILKAIEGQVGGVAEAMNTGINKELNYLKNNLGDTAEEFGAALAPALVEITKLIREILPPIRDFITSHPQMAAGLFGIAVAGAAAVAVLPRLIGLIGGLSKAVMFLAANPIILAVAGIALLGIGIGVVVTAFTRADETGQSFGDTLREMASLALFAAQNVGALVKNLDAAAKGMSGQLGKKVGQAAEMFGAKEFGKSMQEAGDEMIEEAADVIAADVIDEAAMDRQFEELKKRLEEWRKKRRKKEDPPPPPPPAAVAAAQAAANSFASTADVFRRLSTTNPAKTAEKQRETTNQLLENIQTSTKKTAEELMKGLPAKFGP